MPLPDPRFPKLIVIIVLLVAVGLGVAPAVSSAATTVQSAALSQYANSDGFHWDTTEEPTSGYTLQSTLGFLQPASTVPGTAPLYSCQDTADASVHFLSLDSGCAGQTTLDTLGYIYTSAPSSTASVPLYACADGPDHFAATSASCGGDTEVAQLGYLLSSAALERYNGGDHWATTGTPPSGYSLEATLGYVVSSAIGAEALYSCQDGSDQFLYLDPACGGQTLLGVEGWVYGAAGSGLSELFLCNQNSDHFESVSSACEGQTVDGPLGWILNSPLPVPASTPPPASTTPPPTTISPAPAKAGTSPRRRVRVKLEIAWRLSSGTSQLRDLRFIALPRPARVTISCAGRGCPRNLGTTVSSAKHHLTLAALIRRVEQDRFRADERVMITVTRAGYVSERVQLTMRRAGAPLARLLA